MGTTTYLAACLLALLCAIAALSWLLARYRRRHDLRHIQAHQLAAALHRYSQWVCARRLAAVFQGAGRETAQALEEASTIRMAWFPELRGEMAQVLAVHERLAGFLATQQALWLRDPEGWLESDHDKRFLALWRQHRCTVESLLARLEQSSSAGVHSPQQRESTYA